MNPLFNCINYKSIKKFYEAFGDPMCLSVMIVGDPNHPKNIRKQKWFDNICEFDKARRKWLGWDK